MPSIAHLRTLCGEGRLKEAIHILLSTNKLPVDYSIYLQLLQICISKNALPEAKLIHSHINGRGFKFATHTSLQNKLINTYDKFERLKDARNVFEHINEPKVSSWNTIIAANRRHGFPQQALTLFHQMQGTDIHPNNFTFATVLPACAKMGALELGLEIHLRVIESGFFSDVVVVTALIDMYAKCGRMYKARELFNKMPQRNVVSLNAIIVGYVQNGFVEEALEVFKKIQFAGVEPDSSSFASILPACAKVGDLEQGMEIHRRIIEDGFWSGVVIANALIDMYAKCESIEKALKLFDKMSQRDAISWNAIIAGCAQNGALDEALRLFEEMPQPNIVSWTAIIAGCAQNGFVEKALIFFKQMQLFGIMPNSATFASILPACAKIGAMEQGMEIHEKIVERSFFSDVEAVTALVDMYSKCGNIQKARELFDNMSQQNVVSWNAMIAGYVHNGVLDEALRLFIEMPQRNVASWNAIIVGYVQNGLVEEALENFKQMLLAGIEPNPTTLTSILPAYAKLGALENGMEIHQKIIDNGFLSDDVVANALVDMYAKCGSTDKARNLFNKMHHPDVISWTAMIAGYAMHGFGRDALELFELMKDSGTKPNYVSLVCVLFACSHAGLVDEGCKYFSGMSASYGIIPTIDHYVCTVDLLGRADYLEEGLNFIIKMPVKPNGLVWICLLGACRSHKNIGLGEFVATFIFELDPKTAAPYVLLSNTYAEVGRWGDAQMVRKLMKDRGIRKTPGCSWIQVHKMVHVFCVGDKSHPQTPDIYATLEKLSWDMKAAGLIPEIKPALNDVEEEEKELFLGYHSEKLAIAFGLLNTSAGTIIRIVKNLRVCRDCHTVTKFISKIVDREIIVRDANRFHHFKHGKCSCGDYW